MPTTYTTTDMHGHRLNPGDWVRYRGSYTPAYGQLCTVTTVNHDGTMTLEGAAGWKLRGTRRTSVAHAPNNGL
jgi:hypothetical protein